MKILSEKEQLLQEAEASWKSYQTIDTKASRLRSKLFSYQSRWIHSHKKVRMMKFEIEEMDKMSSQLASYSQLLRDRIRKIADSEVTVTTSKTPGE